MLTSDIHISLSKDMHKSLDVDTSLITQIDRHQSVYEGTHINRIYSFKPQFKNRVNTEDIIYFAKDHRLFTLVPVLTIPKENEGKKPFFTTGTLKRYHIHDWIQDNGKLIDPFDKEIRNSNMAIVIPEGMIVIDIDNTSKSDGQNGVAYFTQLVLQHTSYASIEEYCASEKINYTKTPSDGYHLFFQYSPEYHTELTSTFNKCKAIDVKRPGEFVTAPGSIYQGCHPLHVYDKQTKKYTKEDNSPHKCGGSNKDCKYKGKLYTPHFQPVPNPRLGLPEPIPYYAFVPKWIQKECTKEVTLIQPEPFTPVVKVDINHPKLKGLLECCKQAFLADKSTWVSAVWLFKTLLGEDGRPLVHEYSSAYDTYSYPQTDSLFNAGQPTRYPYRLLHKLAKQYNRERYEKITNPIQIDLKFTPDEIVNKEYISSDVYLHPQEVICLQSNMKTGKTHCIPEVIQKLSKEHNREIRVLVVLFRVTLVTELTNKWKHLGFTSYQECDKYIHSSVYPRTIVQIDSLHKVSGKFDLLILDEIESTVNHLTSGHIKHFDKSYRNFITYCTKVPKVFCMDATLQDITIDTLFKNRSIHKIKNTYQSYTNSNVYFTHCKAYFVKLCINELQQGKKVIVPSNSERFIVYLKEMVQKVLPDLRIGIKTALLGEDIKTDDWDKYDLFLFSPTIIAGVSFDKPHFDVCYSFFTDRSCTGDLCAQQLIRARILKDNKFVILVPKPGNETSLSITIEECEDYISDVISIGDAHLYTDEVEYDVYEGTVQKNEYYYLLLSSIMKQNLTKVNLYGYLKKILEMHGMKCTNLRIPLKNKKIEKECEVLDKIFTDCAKKVNREKAVQILNSPILKKDKYDALMKKPSNLLTQEERDSITHTLYINTYGDVDLTPGLLLKRLPYMNGFRSIRQIRTRPIDESIQYASNRHAESYDDRLEMIALDEIKKEEEEIDVFDIPSEDESKFSVKSEDEEDEEKEEEYEEDEEEKEDEKEKEDRIQAFLQSRIQKKEAIRKKVFKGKTAESSKFKMEYSRKHKKLEFALSIIKMCGFTSLADTEKRKVDWVKVEDYILENEKEIRVLWNIEKYKGGVKEDDSDDDEEEEEEKVRKVNKKSLINYIKHKVEVTTGLTIRSTSKGSKSYNLQII